MKGPTMAIKCGSTGHDHETVAQVRACQLGGTVLAAPEAPAAPPAGVRLSSEGISDRLRRQAVSTRYGSGSGSSGYPFRPASEKMTKWVRDILANQEVDADAVAQTQRALDGHGGIGFQTARNFINAWKDAPRKAKEAAPPSDAPALPEVPAGRYALRTDGVVKFYILDRPESGKWAGYAFLNAQASDEKHPIKNVSAKAEILGRILEDIEAAQTLYGRELGRCYACGRTLTDETSRALGIGPDCRSK